MVIALVRTSNNSFSTFPFSTGHSAHLYSRFDKLAKMAAGVGNERSTNVQLLRQLSKQISGEDDSKKSKTLLTLQFYFRHLLNDELKLLKNVYFEDLLLDTSVKDDNQTRLLVHIDPSTAEEKDKQFVYCDLNITVNEKVSEI